MPTVFAFLFLMTKSLCRSCFFSFYQRRSEIETGWKSDEVVALRALKRKKKRQDEGEAIKQSIRKIEERDVEEREKKGERESYAGSDGKRSVRSQAALLSYVGPVSSRAPRV